MKIVIYSRVSTKDRNNSIENQIKLAKLWIDKKLDEGTINEKYVQIEEITDNGYSGSNMNRPGIKKILGYINETIFDKLNKIDILVVKDISRLGRNYIEVGLLINKLYEARINLVCVNKEKEDFSSIQRFNTETDIDSLMADFYSKDISIKTKSVLDMNKRKGMYSIAKVPFGYRKSKENKYVIEIYEPEAKIVRYIFNCYNSGVSINNIVNELNNININEKEVDSEKSKYEENKYKEWNYHKVYRILNNEFYKGTMIYNKSVGHIWEEKKRKYNKRENWKRIENHHKAII